MSGRFAKGQSGNPAGRPRKRRPHVSAFDVVMEKTLSVTQNGVERELTVDEALQIQTYQAALKASKMAICAVLKMIEKREVALAKQAPAPKNPMKPFGIIHASDSADEAMHLLGITTFDDSEVGLWKDRPKLASWATQAAISRPGRRTLDDKMLADARRSTINSDRVKCLGRGRNERVRGAVGIVRPRMTTRRGKVRKGHKREPQGSPTRPEFERSL